MRRLFEIAVLIVGLSLGAWAADITAGVNAANGVLYNKSYRDIKNGTNSETVDVVSGNISSATWTTQNGIKTTGGYLESVILSHPCQVNSYVIADAAAASGSYALVISTIVLNGTMTSPPINVPMKVRLTNGLSINVTFSSCTAVAVYR